MSSSPTVSDPRPIVEAGRILGAACTTCGQVSAWAVTRCPRCLGSCEPRSFGPGGVIWSSASVHLRVGDRIAPFTVAYVDLENGPRVLATVAPSGELAVGTRVRIVGTDLHGDITVHAESDGG